MTDVTMETVVHGKWILAGEHAVLRGSPALVFPVFARQLHLRFEEKQQDGLSVEFLGPHGDELRLLFWGVIERGLEMKGRSRQELRGHFQISSSIPVGAGMGASAALCVGVGRWLMWKGWVTESDLPEFCRQLENLFHGESSGVDIAVAISGQGLHYERSGTRYFVQPKWQPEWYVSYSGNRGVTSECVAKVKGLWSRDPASGEKIDLQMRQAVELSERALAQSSEGEGLPLLSQAIELAHSCFTQWGLAGGPIGEHMRRLIEAGACAVKPTGSGDGGFVLSLWKHPPPIEIQKDLISLRTPTV